MVNYTKVVYGEYITELLDVLVSNFLNDDKYENINLKDLIKEDLAKGYYDIKYISNEFESILLKHLNN